MFENLQDLIEGSVGQAIIVGIIVIMFLIILIPQKGKKYEVSAVTISAIMIALASLLSEVKLFDAPYGGSVTAFSMLPIAVVGYIFGTRTGLMAGMSLGLINLILGPYVIHPAQLLLDYPLAFGAIGLSGMMRDKKNGLIKGYLLGVFARYVCTVLSGAFFFGEYAAEGFNAWTWSLFYNATYIFAEAVITVLILMIPPVKNMFKTLKKRL